MLNWKSVLLTSALIIAPSAYIQAHATTVEAESDWAITKVTAKNPGSAPYCALARRFQNNIIMTIARNTRDETSVAIDFQQPVFNDGESVTLKISAGNSPSRDFIVPPASKKAVVARIGADRALFDEIARAGSLDIGVMGQQYRFMVPDMGNANTQISTCLVSLGNTQSYAANVNAAPQGVDNKIAALQTQIASLQTERATIAKQQTQATVYNNQLKSAAGSSGNEDIASKIAELQLQNIGLRSKMDEQRAALDNVQSNSLEDKSRLALLEETQDQLRRAENETKAFRDQLFTTQNKQDSLLSKLEKYSGEEAKRKELEVHLAGLQNEQAILQAQYSEEKSRLELVQSAQEAVLAQQKEELERTKVELATTKQEKNQLAEQKAYLAEEKQALQGRLQEYSGIKDKLTALADEQKNLGQTVVSLKEEREDLSQKLASEKTRLEKIENDRIALKTELEQKTTQSESEKAKLQNLLDEEKQNRDVVASLETELTQIQTKQNQLSTNLKELESEKTGLQTRVSSLEDKVKQAEAEKLVADEARKLALEEKEKIALNLVKEQEAKAELQTQYTSEQDKRRDVVARLEQEATRRAEIIAQMEAQAIKTQELAQSQEQNTAAREQALADAVQLKAEKEQLALDKKEIALKREELAKALSEADTIIDTQMATIDTLTIKQKGLLSQVTSLEGEKKELLTQLDTHKQQLALRQSDTKTQRNADYEISAIKNDLAKMSIERDELRAELSAMRDQNAKFAQINAPQDDGMNKLYTQIEELEYQRVDLNSALEFERELNNEAPAAGDVSGVAEMKAALAAMRAERDEFNRLLSDERTKRKKLEAVVGPDGASQTSLAELNARVNTLETENVNLLRELEYEKTRIANSAVEGDPVLANAGVDNGDELTIMRLRNEVKRLSGQSKDLEKEQTDLLAQVRGLEAEKQKIVKAEVPKVATNTQETAELKQQIALLKEEKDNLSRALSSKQKMAAIEAETTTKSVPLAPKPKVEISKIESSLAAQNAYVLEQKDSSNREIQSLRAQLSQTQSLLEAREAEKQQLQNNIQVAALQTQRISRPVAEPIIDQEQFNAVSPITRNTNVESDIRNILQNASVSQPSEFGPVTIPVASNVQAWRWKSGQYAGNAEAHYAPDADTRNVMINEFLAKAKSRCPGDFAVIENSRTQSASGLVVSSDIACVAGNNGVAAAIAFVQVGDQIIAISHEAPTSSLAEAMTTRDEIVKTALTRSKT